MGTNRLMNPRPLMPEELLHNFVFISVHSWLE